jgi:hypothetical protein
MSGIEPEYDSAHEYDDDDAALGGEETAWDYVAPLPALASKMRAVLAALSTCM